MLLYKGYICLSLSLSLSLSLCVYTFQLILVYSDYYCIYFKVKSAVQVFFTN